MGFLKSRLQKGGTLTITPPTSHHITQHCDHVIDNEGNIIISEASHIHIWNSPLCSQGKTTDSDPHLTLKTNLEKQEALHKTQHQQWLNSLAPNITLHARAVNNSLEGCIRGYMEALLEVTKGKWIRGKFLQPKEKGTIVANHVTITLGNIAFHHLIHNNMPARFIECNTEQYCSTTKKDGRLAPYLHYMKHSNNLVFDYSATNIQSLTATLGTRASGGMIQWWPFYPQPSMIQSTRIIPTYDVAFLGAKSKRRGIILDNLRAAGLKVFNPKGNSTMTWNEQLRVYSKAKILLNVHWRDDTQSLEQARILPGLCAGRCIVTEDSHIVEASDYISHLPGFFCVPYGQLVQTCQWLLKQDTQSLGSKNAQICREKFNLSTFIKTHPSSSLSGPAWRLAHVTQIVKLPKKVTKVTKSKNDKKEKRKRKIRQLLKKSYKISKK